MNKEVDFKKNEAVIQAFLLFLLTLLSFLAVHFPPSNKGTFLYSEDDFKRLSLPEKRVAKKLLSLGIRPEFETKEILLDEAVYITTKGSGKVVYKINTVPDLNFTLDGVDYFLEIGSNTSNAHKNDQQKVAEKAVKSENGQTFFYVQLFHGHIDQLIDEVHSREELVDFLYNLSHAVYAKPRR